MKIQIIMEADISDLPVFQQRQNISDLLRIQLNCLTREYVLKIMMENAPNKQALIKAAQDDAELGERLFKSLHMEIKQ
jgi:hypothetical protein